VISSSQSRYLNTGQHKHRISTYTYQTSMPCVEFEPTIPASEREKTVHALDRSATVTGFYFIFFFGMKIKATCSHETSVDSNGIHENILGDRTTHNHSCENLKFCIFCTKFAVINRNQNCYTTCIIKGDWSKGKVVSVLN
jgi:hypothetical protein